MNDFERVLIVGSRGMLAGAIQRALTARGVAFAGVDRQGCDITDPGQVRAVFEAHRPTLVINCAGATNVDGCEIDPAAANRVNGDAVGLLAAQAGRCGARLVHYSTDFVFDGQQSGPYAVDAPTHPLSAYGRSKLLGEQRLAEVNPPGYLLVRTAWLYGVPGKCFPRTMVELARRPVNPLKVVADQQGCPTHTDDLAEATLALIERGAAGVFHVTNAGQTTWRDFAEAVLRTWGLDNEVLPLSSAQWQELKPTAARRPTNSVLDLSKTEAVLGRAMRPWREALKDYYAAVERAGEC